VANDHDWMFSVYNLGLVEYPHDTDSVVTCKMNGQDVTLVLRL
jgi:hypothetical protein